MQESIFEQFRIKRLPVFAAGVQQIAQVQSQDAEWKESRCIIAQPVITVHLLAVLVTEEPRWPRVQGLQPGNRLFLRTALLDRRRFMIYGVL